MRLRLACQVTALVVLTCAPATAQRCTRLVPPRIDGADYEIMRALSLIGQQSPDAEAFRRGSTLSVLYDICSQSDSASRQQVHYGLLPVELLGSYNSAYPRDINNGHLWAGKSVSSALTGGARVRFGPFSAALAPLATYSSNSEFETQAARPDLSPYANLWTSGIDLPQRFGAESVQEIYPGDSYVRLDAYGFTAGISTERLWWGPMRVFPLMLGSTAGGFEHLFAGTSRPIEIGIGRITGEFVWGRLHESAFFDTIPANDRRLLAGVVVGFEPRGLAGLTLGATRIRHITEPADELSLLEILRTPYSNVRDNIADNQLLSFFARYAFTKHGFEVFGEWARDDHWEDNPDLVQELDHARAYALGFQKVFRHRNAIYRVHGELAQLAASNSSRTARGTVFFYSNGSVPQGHTERGQMLGAWTGPGSSAQIVGADKLEGTREYGLFVQRVRFNTDAYYFNFPALGSRYHDLELSLGGKYGFERNNIRWRSELTLSRRQHREWLDLLDDERRTDFNLGLQLSATWAPH